MTYSFAEMVSALESIGYTVKEDDEEYYQNYNGNDQYKPHQVWNVYRHGVNMTVDRHWETGSDRVKWVFENEMKSRILQLFK